MEQCATGRFMSSAGNGNAAYSPSTAETRSVISAVGRWLGQRFEKLRERDNEAKIVRRLRPLCAFLSWLVLT